MCSILYALSLNVLMNEMWKIDRFLETKLAKILLHFLRNYHVMKIEAKDCPLINPPYFRNVYNMNDVSLSYCKTGDLPNIFAVAI